MRAERPGRDDAPHAVEVLDDVVPQGAGDPHTVDEHDGRTVTGVAGSDGGSVEVDCLFDRGHEYRMLALTKLSTRIAQSVQGDAQCDFAARQTRCVSSADSVLDDVVRRLVAAGCVAADAEAAELVAAAPDARTLDAWVVRREGGEPPAWITGRVQFWGRTLYATPGVYVPAAQSEELARRGGVCSRSRSRPRPVHGDGCRRRALAGGGPERAASSVPTSTCGRRRAPGATASRP